MSEVQVGTNETDYIYNALGQLIRKSGASGTTLIMYDEAGHILGEYTASGALIQGTVWMGDIPIATIQPNGTNISIYYVHTDHLGTPRKITRPYDNGLMWRWDLNTFGSLAPNSNPAGLGTFTYNLRFPGQYSLNESGLFYNYFRDYDPTMGRYIESDPIGMNGSTASTYAYTDNNSVNHADPLGLFTSDQHAAMSFEVLSNDPAMLPCLTEVITGSVMLDFLPGSQTVPFSYWHAMAQPGQSAAAAETQSNDFINEQIGKCNCRALGYALHTAQDSAAWGHHYKTYYGWVGALHIMGDYFPLPGARAKAIARSKSVVNGFKSRCLKCSK
jgi:RHS repeat-associated protein